MVTQPYRNYLKQEIEGATKGKLVLLLYDGALKFLKHAERAIDDTKLEDAHNNITKAQNILYELMSTLNMDAGGDIADNLLRLYDFMIWQLVEANSHKDKSKLAGVVKLLTDLRDSWRVVVEQEEKNQKDAKEAKSVDFAG